jgi:hypothetical protein
MDQRRDQAVDRRVGPRRGRVIVELRKERLRDAAEDLLVERILLRFLEQLPDMGGKPRLDTEHVLLTVRLVRTKHVGCRGGGERGGLWANP